MKQFLGGKAISLHGLTLDHLRADGPYYSWLNDLSLDIFGERSDFPNTQARMESYYAAACSNDSLVLLGVFDNASDRHIGNITLSQIDWVQRRAFLGYLIGEKDFVGQGIASTACLMIMQYGFNKLNLDRIWTTISVNHAASKRVAEKVGLKEEGILRKHQMRDGARRDVNVLGALREEWNASHSRIAMDLFAEPIV